MDVVTLVVGGTSCLRSQGPLDHSYSVCCGVHKAWRAAVECLLAAALRCCQSLARDGLIVCDYIICSDAGRGAFRGLGE